MRIKSFVAGFLLACFLITGLYASADSGFVRRHGHCRRGVLSCVKLFPQGRGRSVLPMIMTDHL